MKSRYSRYNDAELAELTIQQDNNAFKELYDRYWPHLYAFALKLLKDEEEAKDLLQDTFTNLYQKISKINLDNSVRGYLYASVRNGVLDRVKHEKIKTNYITELRSYFENREKYGELSTDSQVRLNELSRLIEQEIENLPPKMRTIFEMSRKQHLNHREIADQIGISELTVKKTISTAVIKFRKKFGAYFWLLIMASILWINKTL